MDEKQKLLAELLILKTLLIKKLDMGTFRIETEDMLNKVNEIINNVEKL